MITAESILAIKKENLSAASESLSDEDLALLVDWLNLKDDSLRYRAFLLLQSRSAISPDVYCYWEVFRRKLESDNSYQRSIGAMLIAANTKWDTKGKMDEALDTYLSLLNDEKPITIRQTISSLGEIASCKPELGCKIAERLIALDINEIRESMRKSVLLDITGTLFEIRKTLKSDLIESYILNALSGEILDKKSKKQLEARLKDV
jgi:hypothetical protein